MTNLNELQSDLTLLFPPNKTVTATKIDCPYLLEKKYHTIGLSIRVRRPTITGRKQSLAVVSKDCKSIKNKDDLERVEDNYFFKEIVSEHVFVPGKKNADIVTSDGETFSLSLMMNDKSYLLEDTQEDVKNTLIYQLASPFKASELNGELGGAIGLHLKRTGIVVPTDLFNGLYLDADLNKPSTTEQLNEGKMSAQIFVYVRMTVEGKSAIYEISCGAFVGTISDLDYSHRKKIVSKPYADEFCGSMPLMPGVFQLHVLLESSGSGNLSLKEAYCDGDPIFLG